MLKIVIAIALLFFCHARALRGQLLLEAAQTFPAQTDSLEYDNLKLLRLLPNYQDLRLQYASDSLQRARKSMFALGISEDDLTELVTASGPLGFFGLLAGTFHLPALAGLAAKYEMPESSLAGGRLFCSREDVCFFFSGREDGRAQFGSAAQLRAMASVRLGTTPALRARPWFIKLMNKRNPRAPVFGIAQGSEVAQWVEGTIPQQLSSTLNLPALFATIDVFSYSIKLDTKAHLDLNLLCTSETAGRVLADTFAAASGLQRLAAAAGSSAFPFQNIVAGSAGRMVTLTLDAAMPVSH